MFLRTTLPLICLVTAMLGAAETQPPNPPSPSPAADRDSAMPSRPGPTLTPPEQRDDEAVQPVAPPTSEFREGRVSELSGITPVNTIDPFNGRSTVNSRLVYGTLADTVPTVVEGGRLAQEPIYIAFSALDNLIAFERYEPHVRRRYIAAARNNRVVIGASQIGIQPQY